MSAPRGLSGDMTPQHGIVAMAEVLKPDVRRLILWHWPFRRGRRIAARMLLRGSASVPERATFRFKYGTFCETSLAPWPMGYRDAFVFGAMDEAEVLIWKKVLRRGGVVVDAGANWGYWTLIASYLVGPKGTVLAFEPVPSTYAALRRNADASGAWNTVIMRQALSDHPHPVQIFLAANDPIGAQSSAFASGARDCPGSTVCEAVALDGHPALKGKAVDLLKLDIEGGELAALRGASRILSGDQPPVVTVEWNVRTARACGYHPYDMFSFLAQRGYRFYLAGPRGLRPFVESYRYEDWTPMVWCLKQSHLGAVGLC